ncbi:MAG: hypothetical protein CL453_00775 [Acidimicrobiaceae bacterium]|nr:hypothetical protein [Acidimicrobiaceae bacterium]
MNSRVFTRSNRANLIGILSLLAFYLIFFFYPIGKILSLGFSFSSFEQAFTSVSVRKALWFTIWQATVSSALSLAIGTCISSVFVKSEFRFKRFFEGLTFIPFVMPTVVVASAFISVNELLKLDGTPLNLQGTALGIIVAHIFFNTSIVVRTLTSTWPMIDFESEQAAQTLGASKVRIFFQITLPQLKSGLISSGSLAFLFTFTSFGVILILGGLGKATIETEIWRYATQRTEFETAAVLGIVQLLVVVTMLTINNKFLTTDSTNTNLRSNVQYPHPVSKFRKSANNVFILGFFGFPFLVLFERSLSTPTGHSFVYYKQLLWESSDERFAIFGIRKAILNSLMWGSLAMIIATVLGLIAAYLLTNKSRSVSQSSGVFLLLPLGASGVLLGFGILISLNSGFFDFRSEWWIVPVAQGLLGVGIVARISSNAIKKIDPTIRHAASTLGASSLLIWKKIDYPIIAKAVLAGSAFSFALALGEFGATSFLVRPQRPTIPTTIFNLLGRPGSSTFGQAMALSVILAVITWIVISLLDRSGSLSTNDF